MSNENSEQFKRKFALQREELAREEEQKKQANEQVSERPIQAVEREVQVEGDKDAQQLYQEWLKLYKTKKPDYEEEKGAFKPNKQGGGALSFSDPHAEEDFVRHLAANSPKGGVLDKGIIIANFEKGQLIDPRTNKEFPKGGYAALVQQLDAGLAYKDIPAPESATPTPLSTRPY